jgi:hypothetical protein
VLHINIGSAAAERSAPSAAFSAPRAPALLKPRDLVLYLGQHVMLDVPILVFLVPFARGLIILPWQQASL